MSRKRSRRGFTLIETMIAMVILSGVVLSVSVGALRLAESVGDANVRNRAYARADQLVGIGRMWPDWSTLEQLQAAQYNPSRDGFTSVTTVTVDTLGGRRLKRFQVEVRSVPTSLMPTPVRRSISIAAP